MLLPMAVAVAVMVAVVAVAVCADSTLADSLPFSLPISFSDVPLTPSPGLPAHVPGPPLAVASA